MKELVFFLLAGLIVADRTHAEVMVVVNPSANVTTMSKAQVKQIFLGKRKMFAGGQSVVPVIQSEGSISDEFNDKVLRKSASQLSSLWSMIIFTGKDTPPIFVERGIEVKKLVSSNPNMIGYVSSNEVDDSVKVVLTVN